MLKIFLFKTIVIIFYSVDQEFYAYSPVGTCCIQYLKSSRVEIQRILFDFREGMKIIYCPLKQSKRSTLPPMEKEKKLRHNNKVAAKAETKDKEMKIFINIIFQHFGTKQIKLTNIWKMIRNYVAASFSCWFTMLLELLLSVQFNAASFSDLLFRVFISFYFSIVRSHFLRRCDAILCWHARIVGIIERWNETRTNIFIYLLVRNN